MVMLAVKFHKFRLKVLADVNQDGLHGFQVLLLEHITAILCYKDQVRMKRKYTMPAMPQLAVCFAWSPHGFLLQ